MDDEKTFKLCLTMGVQFRQELILQEVVDYLLETLEILEEAKRTDRARGINHLNYDHFISTRHVGIDLLSGSSSGGICGSLTFLANSFYAKKKGYDFIKESLYKELKEK